jgi:excinuclease ABC subunit A
MPTKLSDKAQIRQEIFIKGARTNNLKNIDLHIPKNKLVVITGVSGSGKSSITIDTLYAEGQRRYVESLSSYARQFLMRMKKPDVDFIKGICPAIAIEQKISSGSARSTVGSMTETYDFLRLLYARVGRTYSPISGNIVKKHEVADVVHFILSHEDGTKVQLFIPIPTKYSDRTLEQELNLLLQKGYTRIRFHQKLMDIEDVLQEKSDLRLKKLSELKDTDIFILIDRFATAKSDDENTKRIADSIQTAFYESEGECLVDVIGGETRPFNNRFELDGMEFLEPTPQLFNYNNSYGACPKCEGYGKTIGIDADKVFPDKTKSVYEGAIAPWKGEKVGELLEMLLKNAHKFDFPVHRPYNDLTNAQQKILWTGNQHFYGLNPFFKELEEKAYKIQNRVMLARYRGKSTCPECDGHRLRKESSYIKINGKAITELTDTPISDLRAFFDTIQLNKYDETVGKRLILEINTRLRCMLDLGLGYLTLSRIASTLSGGETQRINLTRTLGSNLTSSMYILDEPSVGLHPKDTDRLVQVLRDLRDLGNTVVVVEHEEEVIKNADFLVDMGPKAGDFGGEVVFAGDFKDIFALAKDSLTTAYMTGRMKIDIPTHRRQAIDFIRIKGARHHNLKNIAVKIPLNTLTVVTGVSGSGKTTLVSQILYPALLKKLGESGAIGTFDGLEGDLGKIKMVEFVNQSPIGKSSRSNPVTYIKAYDAIRKIMSDQQMSKIRGFEPKHFSFNVEGGRCESCQGEGEQIVEMQFLADVRLECEECKGKRFRKEVLDVAYKGKSIFDILNLSVDEALLFFADTKEIHNKLRPLQAVGLGYVRLGQSSSTLSGGEAQRVKLASFLVGSRAEVPIFFIFDEPTTGLHFHDIQKLMDALNALVEKGHTVLVVEHNMEVVKCADWVIDLGPGAGKDGGNLVFEGTPEALAQCEASFTGQYLKEKLV